MGFYFGSYVLQQFATFNLYSMKIKEQTRKLAAGYTRVWQGDVDEYKMVCFGKVRAQG